jgi:hypothetical protein
LVNFGVPTNVIKPIGDGKLIGCVKITRTNKLIRKVNMVEKYKESQHGNKSCYVKKWCQNIGGTWQVDKNSQ